MSVLPDSFYTRKDVAQIARQLLGKKLVSNVLGKKSGGIIVETEAYSFRERGCHAYDNKMTNRNKVMFEAGGVAYVYLCYGIHNLFNVVTNKQGVADAVLVRALEPVEGEEWMLSRMKTTSIKRITSGPGKLTKALGIDRTFDGKELNSIELWIEEGVKVSTHQIISSARIGIDYAGDDALLPWRFSIRDNPWVSK
jgi:DNA-3-methyladenine glycosylase